MLGAVLLTGDGRGAVAALTASGLAAEDFYRERHRRVFRAMVRLTDTGEPVDALTVSEDLARVGELEDAGGASYVHSLANVVPSASNFRAYAEIVKDHSRRRLVIDCGRELIDAVMRGDHDAIAEAEGKLGGRRTVAGLTIEQRQERFAAHLQRGEVETWPWPFHKLNQMTGGIWRGHLTVLIGWSGHGKSVLADQILETVAKHGARCAAYLTEMSALERDLRFVARRTDVPLKRLMLSKLTDEEREMCFRKIDALPFEIVPAGTMTAVEIGRDIRRRGLDVAVVDLLNVVTGREVKDIDESVARLAGLANDTGCHIIGAQHLNRSRLTGHGTYPPEPMQGDIRGSGAVHDLATNVLAV